MRVLLVNDYPPGQGGGAERVVETLARALGALGHEPRLFTSADAPGPRTPISYVSNRRARAAAARAAAAFGPDLVWAHNLYHELSPAVLPALRRAAPRATIVLHAHDAHLVCPNPVRRRFTKAGPEPLGDEAFPIAWPALLRSHWDEAPARSWARLTQHAWNYRVRRAHHAIDLVLSPSEQAAPALRTAGRPVGVVPNPIEGGPPTPPPPSETEIVLLFAGRVAPEKGLAEFVEGCPTAVGPARVRLRIAGEGPDETRVRAAADRAGLAVEWLGRLGASDLASALARAHLAVLPSRVPENAPMLLYEAGAAGRSFLAADQPASREAVRELATGALFDPDDAASIRAAIVGALAAPPPSRDAIARRHPERVVERVLELAAGSRPAGAAP